MNRAVSNVFALITGQTVNLGLNLIIISLSARFLGVENFGKFSVLLAIVTLLSKLFDYGFPSIIFRELSSKVSDYSYLFSALSITLIAFVSLDIILNIVLVFLNIPFTEFLLINLLFFNILLSSKFNNVRDILNTPFKVNLRMNIPMMILLLDNLILLGWVLLMPVFNTGLVYFVIGYVVSNLPGLALTYYFLAKQFNFRLKFQLDKIRWLIKESSPLYGYILLDAIFQQLDILLIKHFHGDYDAGLYSVAIRLVIPLLVIPHAFIQTVFPKIVQNFRDSNILSNDSIIKIVYKILFGLASVFAIIFAFKSTDIVILIFGTDYKQSALPALLLFATQIFIFYSYFTINLFVAYKKQKLILSYAVLVVLINAILNIFLIPSNSFIGASYAKLISAGLGTFFIMILHYKVSLKFYFINIKSIIWLVLIFISAFIFSYFSLFVFLLLSILIFTVVTIFIKIFSEDEVILISKIFNQPKISDYILKFY